MWWWRAWPGCSPGHSEFGFPNSTASEVCFWIGAIWNSLYTAWALQRSASGVLRRIGMALLGLFGGVLLTEVVVFMPPMVVAVLMLSF